MVVKNQWMALTIIKTTDTTTDVGLFSDTGTWVSFSFDVIGETQFHINNLQHFTSYNIMVRACREQEVPDEPTNACSATTTTNERTRRKGNIYS